MKTWFASFLFLLAASLCPPARVQSAPLVVDATAPAPLPETGYLGTATAPDGHTLGASQYLTRDGQPWLPVMGEFLFARFPRARSEAQLLKMKAGGVQIVTIGATAQPLQLRILPLRQDAPVYLEDDRRPGFPASGQVGELRQVEAIPRYRPVVSTRL